jgi:hypothetical protein
MFENKQNKASTKISDKLPLADLNFFTTVEAKFRKTIQLW